MIRRDFGKNTKIRFVDLDPATGNVTIEFQDGSKETRANFTEALLDEWQSAGKAGVWYSANLKGKSDAHPVVGAPNIAPEAVASEAPAAEPEAPKAEGGASSASASAVALPAPAAAPKAVEPAPAEVDPDPRDPKYAARVRRAAKAPRS